MKLPIYNHFLTYKNGFVIQLNVHFQAPVACSTLVISQEILSCPKWEENRVKKFQWVSLCLHRKAKYSKGYLVGRFISPSVILEKKDGLRPLKKIINHFFHQVFSLLEKDTWKIVRLCAKCQQIIIPEILIYLNRPIIGVWLNKVQPVHNKNKHVSNRRMFMKKYFLKKGSKQLYIITYFNICKHMHKKDQNCIHGCQ